MNFTASRLSLHICNTSGKVNTAHRQKGLWEWADDGLCLVGQDRFPMNEELSSEEKYLLIRIRLST